MIEVNSVFAVFVVQGLVALFLLVVIVTFSMSRRKNKERAAVNNFVNNLSAGENSRKEEFGARLSESCDLEGSAIDDVLTEINTNEKILYRHIVKMVLGRDPTLLSEIDNSVKVLSEPFFKLLVKLSSEEKVDPAVTAMLETANAEIQQFHGEHERLSKQLNMARQIMDEVSNEYSKIFDSPEHTEDLDASRKRMLDTYKRAEDKMKEVLEVQPTDDMDLEFTKEIELEEL